MKENYYSKEFVQYDGIAVSLKYYENRCIMHNKKSWLSNRSMLTTGGLEQIVVMDNSNMNSTWLILKKCKSSRPSFTIFLVVVSTTITCGCLSSKDQNSAGTFSSYLYFC